MVDGHIHIERGSYSKDWINQFVNVALQRGISEIYLLEHSHRFREFASVYKLISDYSEYQNEWLSRKMEISLNDYILFVAEMRQIDFPIKVKFGLEVCYIEGEEGRIKDLINDYDWDFVTGSVHWIDGWGFDHKKEFWEGKGVEKVYKRYYEIMENLIKSRLFDTVAHPDSIKCFGHQPTYNLSQTYARISDLLNEYEMYAEQSAGLYLNYGFKELGMNRDMLRIFKDNGVRILTASDAHKPEDVGRFIKEMNVVT